MQEISILKFVIERLQASRGKWPEIASDTGVPYHTITKIASGSTEDPGVRKIETLAAYFRQAA